MGVIDKIRSVKNSKIPFCTMIIPAAGSSQRMNGANKLFENVCGVSVLKRTLCAVDQSKYISEIIIPTKSELIEKIASICGEAGIKKSVKIIIGGNTRQESVYAGVLECSKKTDIIAVHDAARPLVLPQDIDRIILECIKTNAVIPAIPVTDTIKVVKDQLVDTTPKRELLYIAQTPQVFQSEILKAALTNAINKKIECTDDCSAVEAIGKKVYIVDGNKENIKITTPIDIIIAEAILKNRENI